MSIQPTQTLIGYDPDVLKKVLHGKIDSAFERVDPAVVKEALKTGIDYSAQTTKTNLQEAMNEYCPSMYLSVGTAIERGIDKTADCANQHLTPEKAQTLAHTSADCSVDWAQYFKNAVVSVFRWK